jgi:hypothetical protein
MMEMDRWVGGLLEWYVDDLKLYSILNVDSDILKLKEQLGAL